MSDSLLDNIRIVEFATSHAASLGCLFLAEVGAEVIKIEPRGGDSQRQHPSFATTNRSKHSVELDLTEPSQRQQLTELLCTADLFIHDLTPTQSKALRLDDQQLAEQCPNLITVTLTGMPIGHPDEDMPCVDSLVLARGGMLDYLQPQARESGPVYLRFPLATHNAAYLVAIGALARLRARDQGAGAGAVHTSLLQGAMVPLMMLCHRAANPTPGIEVPPKNLMNSLVECSDGVWLHIMSPADHVASVKAAIDQLDPAWCKAENAKLPSYQQHIPSFMLYREIFKTRSSQEWLEDLWANDVAVDAATPFGQLYNDAQARINGYVVEVDDPRWGKTWQPGSPLLIQPAPAIKWPTQPSGASTEAILSELESMPRRSPAAAASTAARTDLQQPLAGVRVLDLGNFLAGPLATELMAELGATVIKLEATSGDMMRWVEWAFCGAQRGKRCIAVDLKSPDAQKIIERLVRWADIVHHNLRMPAAARLGLGYEALRAINPAIIYSHVNAYGPQGPRRGWPGFDQMMQSAAGWEVACAGEGNPPMWIRFGMTDHICALSSLLVSVLALYHRDRTGEGQSVSASLLGATAITLGETLGLPDGSVVPCPQLDQNQTGISPCQRLYPCHDGWLSLLATPDQLENILKRTDCLDVSMLEQYFQRLPVVDAISLCQEFSIYATPVVLQEQCNFLDDADYRRLGLVAAFNHPVYGQLETLGQYWHFAGMQPKLDLPPPTLGQHTTEILRELDFSGEEIAAMRASGLVAETGHMSIQVVNR